MSLLPLLQENTDEIPLEAIMKEMRKISSTPGAKDQMAEEWYKLKQVSFVRPIVTLYFTTILSCFTTIQLSLLSRRKYFATLTDLHSMESLDAGVSNCIGCTSETCVDCLKLRTEQLYLADEQAFLSLSWFLLRDGYSSGLALITETVRKEIAGKSHHSLYSFDNLADSVKNIRETIEKEVFELTSWILPKEGTELSFLSQMSPIASLSPHLQDLVNETRDFLESDQFAQVLGKSLDYVFSKYLEDIYPQFYPAPDINYGGSLKFEAGMPSPEAHQPESRKIPLAKICPWVSNSAKKLVHGENNDLVKFLLKNVVELKVFGILVYSGWE